MEINAEFAKKGVFLFLILISFSIPYAFFRYDGLFFVFNTSNSLPGFLYLARHVENPKISDFKSGDIIVFKHSLYKQNNLLKRISHKSGEDFKAEKVFKPSPYHQNTKTSVPFNHVAVRGDHPKSVDSRYEEFGFVEVQTIKGVAWKIL